MAWADAGSHKPCAQEVVDVCADLLQRGGEDPDSPDHRRIVDLVRTSNEVSRRGRCPSSVIALQPDDH